MSTAILSVFESSDLDIYEKSALILIRTLSAQHDSVFPSYDTIAAMCSMSRRKAIYVIQRLVSLGLITKESRGPKPSKPSHQKSNEYKATSSVANAPDAPTEVIGHAPDAPYKSSSLNQDIKTEEDNIYIPFDIPSEIKSAILAYIASFGANIRQYSAEAIRNAFAKAAARIKAGVKFDNFPKWIAVTIRNEDFALSQRPRQRSWGDVLQRAKMATAHLR